MNDKLHEEYWQACEARKEYALAHYTILQRCGDEERARFIELWREVCERVEYNIVREERFIVERWGERGEREVKRRLLQGAYNAPSCAMKRLHEEMEKEKARKEGYEEGRKAGIVEVFDRDKKNIEKGQGFTETPQGRKKREKAELIDRACTLYRTGKYTWEEATKLAAKQLGLVINKLRSRAEQARLAYSDWLKKHQP